MPKLIVRTNHDDPYFATEERKKAGMALSKRKFNFGDVVEGKDAEILSKLGVAVDEKDWKVLEARGKVPELGKPKTTASK